MFIQYAPKQITLLKTGPCTCRSKAICGCALRFLAFNDQMSSLECLVPYVSVQTIILVKNSALQLVHPGI
jgi:hypothetical protein